MNSHSLFFGVGSGRCGTMTFSNLLNLEKGVVALHEGKFRNLEKAGDQVLPFLTLQNFQAYQHPHLGDELFEKTRSQMMKIGSDFECSLFGDIAYNYAPFVRSIIKFFPSAKLLFIYRDGRDFVRSAYTNLQPDPAPVGWLDRGRKLSNVERFVALGRLRPVGDNKLIEEWEDLSPIAKNAWLWAETNRLILEGIQEWPKNQVLSIRFEDFFKNPQLHYKMIRKFLGIKGNLPERFEETLNKKINFQKSPILKHWSDWDTDTRNDFDRHASQVMSSLGYK